VSDVIPIPITNNPQALRWMDYASELWHRLELERQRNAQLIKEKSDLELRLDAERSCSDALERQLEGAIASLSRLSQDGIREVADDVVYDPASITG
jgi:hypothetical protein